MSSNSLYLIFMERKTWWKESLLNQDYGTSFEVSNLSILYDILNKGFYKVADVIIIQ